MHDAAQIKTKLLNGSLEGFLSHLLPAGQVKGHEFRAGDVSGVAGKSLVVELRGARAGLWFDGADSGARGDIYDLACQAWNVPFKEAFGRICTFLGVTHVERPALKPRPLRPDVSAVRKAAKTPVHEYLRSRKIADETLALYRIRSHTRNSPHNTDFVCFSFWTPDQTTGDPAWFKSTGINKTAEGKKDIWSTPPWSTLWGWWLVKPHHRRIAITEGEIDAMSLHQLHQDAGLDVPVLSLPSGVANLDWIENDFDTLALFERIDLCFDGDPAGETCAKKVAQRLGFARCWRVNPPAGFKDVNDVLMRHNEPEQLEVTRWLENASTYNPATLCSVNDVWEDALALAARRKQAAGVSSFIWSQFAYEFRDGEMTLVAGYAEGGKSTFLYQSHLHEMANGRKCLFCSFEIKPEAMLLEFLSMLGGDPASHRDWLNDRLVYVRPPRDGYTLADLGNDVRYAAGRYGVTRVAIDSLHYLAGKEDYEAQDKVVRDLHRLAGELNSHVALVAHSPKRDVKLIPGMYDIEGSGGIVKPVDNVLVVWRNALKEEAIEKAREKEDTSKETEAKKQHDGVIIVRKQRLTGKHPWLRLWHDTESKCFRPTAEAVPAIENKVGQPQELF